MYVNISRPNAHGDSEIDVQVDEWDLWNLDCTIATIVLPLLEAYRDLRDGAPQVCSSDVPALEPSEEPLQKFVDRWNWVLGEMIFAFKYLSDPSLEEAIYEAHSNNDELGVALRDVEKRVDNGLRLFGKYARCLWT